MVRARAPKYPTQAQAWSKTQNSSKHKIFESVPDVPAPKQHKPKAQRLIEAELGPKFSSGT